MHWLIFELNTPHLATWKLLPVNVFASYSGMPEPYRRPLASLGPPGGTETAKIGGDYPGAGRGPQAPGP